MVQTLLQTFSPRARRSVSTASIPFLSMMRRPLVETRSFTQRFSLSTQKRWLWRLGRKRRLLLMFECDTLFPVIGRFPVTWQTRDMGSSLKYVQKISRSLYPESTARASFLGEPGGFRPGRGPPSTPPGRRQPQNGPAGGYPAVPG